MRRIISNNRVAVQRAAHLHRLSSHMAAQANARGMQQRLATMRAVMDRYLGDLPDRLVTAFGLTTDARRILMAAATERHIVEQRRVSSEADAQIAAYRIHEAIRHSEWWLRGPNGSYCLIGTIPSADRHLKVALKFVPASMAKSGGDEWWVATAFPFGTKTLRRMKARHLLTPLLP